MAGEISEEEAKILVSKLIRAGILERTGKDNVRFTKEFIDDVITKSVMIVRNRNAMKMLASECNSIEEMQDDVMLTAIVATLMEWGFTTSLEETMFTAQILLNIIKRIQREAEKRELYYA